MTKGRVMLVEDDPLFQRLVQGILLREGYESCCMATSGEEAISMVSACTPDLVLMDINLEGDLNGIETAEQISQHAEIPVVFLSANTEKAVLEQVQRAAPYGFVSKPFRSEQLLAAIKTALHRHRLDRHVHDSRDWLSTVLGGVTDGVVSIDIQGLITFLNPAAEALLGSECLGRLLSSVIPGPEADVEATVNRVVEKKTGSAVDRL
ncbi:MAG: response regulator, partial [Acidobacteriota bacterium]